MIDFIWIGIYKYLLSKYNVLGSGGKTDKEERCISYGACLLKKSKEKKKRT